MTEASRLDHPVTGRCLCGAVTITVEAMEAQVDICHCAMCQRWSGAFYAGVKGENVTVEGEAAVTAYRSSEWAERAFCGTCGSNLWYRFLPTGSRSFLAGLFDLPTGFGIERQIFVDEKPDWYDIAQESPMLTGEEIIAEAEAAGFSFG
ncbi:GFA family protein [Erythrobacter sp. WG]|uniref:GFA family protein n=1 Tax=Erythrobacter sp. WG TaxID=2985510 RepID=UPI00227022DE|nr:GFA family protein [Erythrobacter sp. WG]MCX9147481.1 GFA family protein [Erythrobacter sp. WG]